MNERAEALADQIAVLLAELAVARERIINLDYDRANIEGQRDDAEARAVRAEAEVERLTEALMEALALVGQYADGKLDPLVALGKIGHKLLAARAVLAGQEGKPE